MPRCATAACGCVHARYVRLRERAGACLEWNLVRTLVQDNPANAGPIQDAVVPDVALASKLCGFPDEFKFGKYKVHNGLALGNIVVPAMGAFVARFAKTLIPFAGDGAEPDVQYVSNYPIRPVRFVGDVDETGDDARPRRRRKID